MTTHLIFDVLAWLSALSVRRYCRGRINFPEVMMSGDMRLRYYVVLLIGASMGAMLSGTFNVTMQFPNALGHSVLGGIIGGTATVELFKWLHKIDASTGTVWVLPLAVGIAVGRLGCFMAGLSDYTYGIPTSLPWGVDFGDGIHRHPVQLYESVAMLSFACITLLQVKQRIVWFSRYGFYVFTIYYAGQRFAWEFLKPYAKIAGPFNLFHFLCLLLAVYGVLMILMKRTR